MNLKEFISNEDAVSPVIGVILMVAITVILAAVIGTFVLGLGDQVQDTAPQASFSFDYDMTDSAGADDEFTVTHDGGDSLEGSNLEVVVDGNTVSDASNGIEYSGSGWATEVNAGNSVTVTETSDVFESGASVRVIWTSSNGDTSATLGEGTTP